MIWKVLHLLAGKLAQYWRYVAGITGEMSLDTFFNCCRNTPWNGRKHSLQRNYHCIKPNKNFGTLFKCFKFKHYIQKHDPISSRPKMWPYSIGMSRCHQNWFRIMWDEVSRGSSCATRNEVDKLQWMLMCPGKNELVQANVTGYRYLRNIVKKAAKQGAQPKEKGWYYPTRTQPNALGV